MGCWLGSEEFSESDFSSPTVFFFETRVRFGDSYLIVWISVFFWGMGRKDVGPYGVLVFLLCQMPDWFFFLKKKRRKTPPPPSA